MRIDSGLKGSHIIRQGEPFVRWLIMGVSEFCSRHLAFSYY